MILTAGLIAGTFAFQTATTPLQPYTVQRVDNNVTKVYSTKDTTIHLSNTKDFEIIAYTDKALIVGKDNAKSIDVKVKKGETVYIDAQAGYNTESYKIGNHKIYVNGVK